MDVHEEEAKVPERCPVEPGVQTGVIGGAFVLMMVGRIAGAAISPLLLAHAPLALLAISPVIAHMVVVAALSDALPYYLVTVPVTIFHCGLGFFLGRLQGPRVVDFLVRKNIASEAKIQRLLTPLRVSAPLLVFVVPGPLVCALAGASSVLRRTFLPALVGSQVLWAVLCRLSGQALLGGIAEMRQWFVRHALPLTAVTVAIVVLIRLLRTRRKT